MAVKRRTIWMSDEHWGELHRVVERIQAETKTMGLTQRITPSLVILDCLDRGHFRGDPESFNSVPFTPVPKKGK